MFQLYHGAVSSFMLSSEQISDRRSAMMLLRGSASSLQGSPSVRVVFTNCEAALFVARECVLTWVAFHTYRRGSGNKNIRVRSWIFRDASVKIWMPEQNGETHETDVMGGSSPIHFPVFHIACALKRKYNTIRRFPVSLWKAPRPVQIHCADL